MKIAIIAANGKAGKLLTDEAVKRGHEVTAIVRSQTNATTTTAQHTLIKDLFALTADDLLGFDVVLSAFGTWTAELLPQTKQHAEHLSDLLAGSDTLVAFVGGAGSLYLDQQHTTQLADSADFPAEYLPVATAHAETLDYLRGRSDVQWLYVSPAADFIPDAPATGDYVIAGEEFSTGVDGTSTVSYADYAAAFLDAIEAGNYRQQRISVRNR